MYSQALRVKRICSDEEDFKQHINEMRPWFQKRAYPNKILDEELAVCSYHVMYAFHNESTLYSCQNVKDLLARLANWPSGQVAKCLFMT